MLSIIDEFYLKMAEPQKSCLLALRSIILQYNPAMNETQKYGMPCFCYKNKIVCYLWIDKKTDEPYILMADGKLLDHPMLESGERSRMKILRVNAGKDLPLKAIQAILHQALNLHHKLSS